jgi:hypothetical protein
VLAVVDITVLDDMEVGWEFLRDLGRSHDIVSHHCRPILNQLFLARRYWKAQDERRRKAEMVFCQAFATLKPHLPKNKGRDFPERCEWCRKAWDNHVGDI